MTKSDQQQIDAIMQRFDFKRVRTSMIQMRWEWTRTGIPDMAELRACALELLTNFVEDLSLSRATGGFVVDRGIGKRRTLRLRFEVASYQAGEEEWE